MSCSINMRISHQRSLIIFGSSERERGLETCYDIDMTPASIDDGIGRARGIGTETGLPQEQWPTAHRRCARVMQRSGRARHVAQLVSERTLWLGFLVETG